MKYTLIINAGSSSLKFKLFESDFNVVAEGIVEKVGLNGSFIDYKIGKNRNVQTGSVKNHKDAIKKVFILFEQNKLDINSIVKIGHRVVHGGEEFVKPVLIDNKTLLKIDKYSKLAPLHNPNNIAGIKACQKLLPKVPNYAVFDTSFHNTISEEVFLYPLPLKFYKKHQIRKYGFHGISHQYATAEAGKKLKKKSPNLITCHLGSGCSITAIQKGKSIDTSMGFTPLEGLMMMTRSGNIDPAIIFYLMGQGYSAANIEDVLIDHSGLKGVSGLSDMRDIMIGAGYKIPGYNPDRTFVIDDKKSAKLALDMFVNRIKKYIGSYSAILEKVDAIVFTGGIGERNKDVRDLIMKGLPKYKVVVVEADEELMIAKKI
ncbi:acetate/propionate family kinase [Candidatus Falkowbacteria bacterium]|nr:acetate/propionate family kinase [Candidatus Falkowbacteria bacterium]